MRRTIRVAMAAMTLLCAPASAQQGSDGEAFLSALRESSGGKAYALAEASGSTVINYRGENGVAPLHIVVRTRNANWIGFLLANGADPDVADDNGDTPLILAARGGFTEGAARLLMNRAEVDKANRLGETALIAAVQQRQPRIVRMLLESGADADKADHAAGYSARDYARRETRTAELLTLIETVKSRRKAAAGPTR